MSPRRAAALRDRDDHDLREHLIATAERLIAEQGSTGLTVRAIARAAGVADGVLYNHFADKEELLAAALRAHVDAVHRGLPPLPAPGTATVEQNLNAYLHQGLSLHRAILPVFTGLLAQPAVLAKYADAPSHERDWRDALTDYLTAERDLGRLSPDADLTAAVAILVGICHDAVLSALLPGAPRSHPVAPVDSVITTLLRGIGAF
ncbi:TetR/AcrR family transcriptional regulator [Nocardia transvalensis]|uniref:TetR/AcrR family transcriptional regulator n=1 Tax=Nocardia transvalensis TaxID=37333 RepID=UPI0018951136|nr:TetR/AcrR family transcriptional regulator [Nocardia transvalensis]MBF6329976.1 TetR/AcrR family transcriptional regulator [Nocardia transvalensis]